MFWVSSRLQSLTDFLPASPQHNGATILFNGGDSVPRGLSNVGFSPRIAFAYRPKSKMLPLHVCCVPYMTGDKLQMGLFFSPFFPKSRVRNTSVSHCVEL
ncbi:hypothetical protein AMECASPLE_029955 [Ameca splendens]|uniref:Uncharacterized protein n=1 Tax=Ameca splendens TaxID=208324 RepID=A0ABV1ADM1_9TELE